MTPMLVLETANNPGNALNIQLAGAPTGYRTWIEAAGNGKRCEYVMQGSDGQFEWGTGYPTAGTPNVFTRETVLGGSYGPAVRVPFTGQVDIYSDLLPERTAPLDSNGKVPSLNVPDARLSTLLSTKAQGVPNLVNTYVVWGTVGTNTLAAAPTVPSTGMTIPETGAYQISAGITLAANLTGSRSIALMSGGKIFKSRQFAASPVPITLEIGATSIFAAGTNVEIIVSQDSGGVLSAGGNAYDNLTILRLRG